MKIIKRTNKICNISADENLVNLIHKNINVINVRNGYLGLEQSKSILLKYNQDFSDGMIPAINPDNQILYKEIEPIIKQVQNRLPPSFCTRALISWLSPDTDVKPHIDPGWVFGIQRRYAWVIKTNADSFFYIENKKYSFEIGDVWEFDNKKIHSAVNQGTTDRIHLIFDLAILDEVRAMTPEPFLEGSYEDKLFRIVLNRKSKTNKFEI